MSVSVETKSGKRKVDANLNLVPFIDLLSVCIIFLIATAVWIELSSLPVDQSLSDPGPAPPPVDKPPPLTIHVRADGLWVGRDVAQGRPLEQRAGRYDWAALDASLARDRGEHPDDREVVIVTDDGVGYAHMISALDLSRTHGYDKPLLGGGPASGWPGSERWIPKRAR